MRGTNGVVADKVEGESPCVLVAVEHLCSPFIRENRTRPDKSHRDKSNVLCALYHVPTQADARHIR